jgi:MFS family permease
MKKILTNKNFLLLWIGQIFEQFGDSLNLMALIAWVINSHSKEGSNAIYMSLLMFWLGLPIIALGPFAGVWVDRLKKKFILQFAAASRGTLVLIMFFIIMGKENIWFVYFIVFFISIVTQFFIPAKSSFIPEIVEKNNLLIANSLSATTTIIVQIFSYAIGGIIVAEIGIDKTLLINVFTYIISFTTLSLINVKESIQESIKIKLSQVMNELKDGFLFIKSKVKIQFIVRRVFILMIIVGFFYISFTSSFVHNVISASKINLQDIKAIGFMQGFLGLGLVCGIFLIEKILKKISPFKLIRLLFPFVGILIIIFYITKNFYYMLFMAFLSGICGVMILSIAETMIQNETPVNLRGRIFAAYYVLRNIGTVIASILTGPLTLLIKPGEIILLTGLGLILYGIINIFSKFKDLKTDLKVIFKGGPWVK